MRAFNARKICKQHWLFKNKQRKLALTFRNLEDNINDNVRVFLKEKHTNDFLIEWRCGGFSFLDQVCKILLGTGRFYSINKFAKSCGSRRDCKVIFLNDRKIIKIEKKEFTRKQFSEARNDFLKIIEIDKIIKGDNNESV